MLICAEVLDEGGCRIGLGAIRQTCIEILALIVPVVVIRDFILGHPGRHLFDEVGIVDGAAILLVRTCTPLRIGHPLAMALREIAMPAQTGMHIESRLPTLLRRFRFRIDRHVVEIETDEIDDVVTGIGSLRRESLAESGWTPVELESRTRGLAQEYGNTVPILGPSLRILVCAPWIPVGVELPADADHCIRIAAVDQDRGIFPKQIV